MFALCVLPVFARVTLTSSRRSRSIDSRCDREPRLPSGHIENIHCLSLFRDRIIAAKSKQGQAEVRFAQTVTIVH